MCDMKTVYSVDEVKCVLPELTVPARGYGSELPARITNTAPSITWTEPLKGWLFDAPSPQRITKFPSLYYHLYNKPNDYYHLVYGCLAVSLTHPLDIAASVPTENFFWMYLPEVLYKRTDKQKTVVTYTYTLQPDASVLLVGGGSVLSVAQTVLYECIKSCSEVREALAWRVRNLKPYKW